MTLSMPINTWGERAAFAARVDALGLNKKMSARLVNPAAKQLGWPLRLPNGTAASDMTQWLKELDELFELVMLQVMLPEMHTTTCASDPFVAPPL